MTDSPTSDDLPTDFARFLHEDARGTWVRLRGHLPAGAYLAGGTAVAFHCRARAATDLDFFTTEPLDVQGALSRIVLAGLEPGERLVLPKFGVLVMSLSGRRVEITDASRSELIEPTSTIAGIEIAGLGDLLAMKLSVITKRKEMRDFADLKAIEEIGGRRVEEGLSLFVRRYGLAGPRAAAGKRRVVHAIQEAERCLNDPLRVPKRADIDAYWRYRFREIAAWFEAE